MAVKPAQPTRARGNASDNRPVPADTPLHPKAPLPTSSQPEPLPLSHYENFPVASWLCPKALRPPITAIYWFARTADDIADEGAATADARLAELAAYEAEWRRTSSNPLNASESRWPHVFAPLAREKAAWQIPEQPLADLLDAFRQDVRMTRDEGTYADRAQLLDYCSRSANPVGRLLLHLWGVDDATSLAQSDAICSALQLINFWQDVSVDVPRGRHYLPDDDCARHGVPRAALAAGHDSVAVRALVRDEVEWARALMLKGAPLVHRVPGRAGWELRAVVQGGLCILDRIEAIGFDTLRKRPKIGRADALPIAWRALWM